MPRKLIVEFLGTFFLVMTIGCVVVNAVPGAPSSAFAPVAIGAALMVMVYAGGHISGAHYNPAVTLAVALRGKCGRSEVLPYWAAQVLGASAAALVVLFLKGTPPPPTDTIDIARALLAEFLVTFALAYVVLNVATARGTEGNSNYGLAIGLTVMAGAFAVGGISGGAFNPAVAVGISILGLSSWQHIWLFLVANFAGGLAAAALFNMLDLGDDKPTNATPQAQADLKPAAASR